MQGQSTEAKPKRKATPGIVVRHARSCASRAGKPCSCAPSYEAWVYSARDGKKIRQTFPTISAAKGWRADASSALRKGTLRAPTATTLEQAGAAWIEGAKSGAIRDRSGGVYKPSTIRGYEQAIRDRVVPELGGAKLSAVTVVDLQDLADRWLAKGLDPSTIRNTFMPLRAIFRRALSRGEVAINPTTGLQLAAVKGKRERIAEPGEAARLLAALPESDRAVWATAFYAGLRRGELRSLRWEDVDLASGTIRVERGFDDMNGPIEPKTKAGTRSVPIAGVLRDYLLAHKAKQGRDRGLVFGNGEQSFTPTALRKRALAAWKAANEKLEEAGAKDRLTPIGLHEARHTFASLLIEAGVSPKKVSTYMGHSSVAFTFDRYAKLFEAHEQDTLEKLDDFLERADTAARLAQVEGTGS